ncbi:hypothetical protein ABVF11_02305 [Pediococcus argentinicus]|uniref:hypothetical protein n=1 Tax=Pediococcus argentinicus TaxID=480391 RepID=UPI00338DAD40
MRFRVFIISNISLILMVLALIAFTVAGFLFNLYLGLSVLGISLFYLSFILRPKGGDE